MPFHPRLAPVKAAIFPLVNKDGMPEKAQALYRELKTRYHVAYDEKGAVGRRYRRQDEAGTPYCITIDGQTLQDDTVTFRDRDTTQQWRVPVRGAADELRKRLQPGAGGVRLSEPARRADAPTLARLFAALRPPPQPMVDQHQRHHRLAHRHKTRQ